MSSYKIQQRHVAYRGRAFHFVSYEAKPARASRQEVAEPPMWYLMSAGKRWPVMPQLEDQPELDLERALTGWLAANVFAETTARRR